MMRELLVSGALIACVDVAFAVQPQPDYSTPFYLDQWQYPLPNRSVHVTSTNSNFSTGDEYAGVFSGYHGGINDAAHRWDVFCTELNHNIYLNAGYNAQVWNNFMNQPITTGSPADDGGSRVGRPLITFDQKFLIEGIMQHCLQLAAPRGLDPIDGNGRYTQTLFAYDRNGKTPSSLSNEQAAATQMLIWEIVHENWNYATHDATKEYDPTWLRTQAPTVIDLNSGWLTWSNISGNDAAGHDISYYFNAEKTCVLNYYFQSVPEATTVLMGAVAVCPFLISRRRLVQA